MSKPTPEQVEAALKYGRGGWNYDDLKPLARPGYSFDYAPHYACRVLAAEVQRLREEATQPNFSTFHCYKCEMAEDRLAQTLKALRQLVHEVHSAHKAGLPVAPYCADMLTAIQLLASIKSPTSES